MNARARGVLEIGIGGALLAATEGPVFQAAGFSEIPVWAGALFGLGAGLAIQGGARLFRGRGIEAN
jgi:hypothetical protein